MKLDIIDRVNPSQTSTSLFEFPSSLAQQRFWVLDQLNPGEPSFNIAVRWRLKGRVDPTLVERAFQAMLRRHDVLRTTFRSEDGEPVQVVWPEVEIKVPLVDLMLLPEAEREPESERVTVEDAKKRFDLRQPPLIRATLLRFNEEEHIVLVVVHHIVADGWSIGIMANELCEFYQAFRHKTAAELPELPIQYADFSVWQREWLQSGAIQPYEAYWKQKLSGLKQFELPTDFPRPAMQTSNGTILSGLLPRPLTHGLKDFSNRQGVTLYTTALATFKMLMWQWSGLSDIAVGTQVAGRNQVELEDLVGVFINTLLLRSHVSGDLSFHELLRQVQDTVTEAIAHQEMPFERLVEILRPKRDLSRNPLFGINFIYQRAFIRNRDFAGISLIDLPSRSPGAIYDLNFFMVERVEGWRWSCEYNTDLYAPETVKKMLSGFEALLGAVLENPDRRIREFPTVSGTRDGLVPAAAKVQTSGSDEPGLKRVVLESKLTKIWEELLDVSPIATDADFFELGGHSILATRMLARAEKVSDKRVTLAAFFQSPTIHHLSGMLLGENGFGPSIPGVAPLQPEGSKPPFFWINGWPSVRNLALEIGTDQPMYSVNLPDLGMLKPPYDVKEIARRYTEIIRQARPHGPYYLGGWCRAGLIAYEVAQQLCEAGEETGLLALFDTWSPTYLEKYSKSEARQARIQLRLERIRFHLNNLRRKPMREALPYAVYHARNVWERVKVSMLKSAYHAKTELGLSVSNKVHNETEIIFLATGAYKPQRYAGNVILFRFDEYKNWKYWDPRLGWDEYFKQLEVHEIPGRHDSAYFFVGPHLPSVGKAIAQSIERSTVGNRQLAGVV